MILTIRLMLLANVDSILLFNMLEEKTNDAYVMEI